MKEHGTFYSVGTGPGDPELITLKAARVMRECDVILLPAKDKESCAAYQIAVQAVPEIAGKEIFCTPMPMTKDKEKWKESHKEAAKAAVSFLSQGKNVAFLTLGDSTVYATAMYVYRLVQEAGEKTQIINGIPSFCAAAARLDMCLAEGEEELHVIPASYEPEEAMALHGVRVFMKAGKNAGRLKELFLEHHVQVKGVERCGMEGERIFHSAEEIDENAGYFSLFIVR